MITNFRHDNARQAQRKKYLGILLGVLAFFLVFRSPMTTFLSSVLHTLARPLWMLEQYSMDTLHDYRYLLASKQSLREENTRLQGALDLASTEAYSRASLRNENEALKAVLGRHIERKLLLARVLATPGRIPYDTLVIDVGTRMGMTLGMRVLIDGDFAIGEVTRVFAESAVVTLYSSSGTTIPVTVGTSSIPALAYGMGGGNFRFMLPKGLAISSGDVIEIPSLAPLYAGVVESIEEDEGSSLQVIHFKLPVNIATLRFVYITASEDMASVVSKR